MLPCRELIEQSAVTLFLLNRIADVQQPVVPISPFYSKPVSHIFIQPPSNFITCFNIALLPLHLEFHISVKFPNPDVTGLFSSSLRSQSLKY